MNNIIELPMMMSAKDLQTMGFGRGMAYRLLRGDIVPVVTIGKRKFIRQNTLLDWLDEKEKSSEKKAEISADAILPDGGELYNNDGT
ncbi:MAG: helix-turn-helix domain-containing protein [Oscillospiraceae bacterium]|nr:helix-turn-helix domain-containing protein [Oscillospiraceae bacterium]